MKYLSNNYMDMNQYFILEKFLRKRTDGLAGSSRKTEIPIPNKEFNYDPMAEVHKLTEKYKKNVHDIIAAEKAKKYKIDVQNKKEFELAKKNLPSYGSNKEMRRKMGELQSMLSNLDKNIRRKYATKDVSDFDGNKSNMKLKNFNKLDAATKERIDLQREIEIDMANLILESKKNAKLNFSSNSKEFEKELNFIKTFVKFNPNKINNFKKYESFISNILNNKQFIRILKESFTNIRTKRKIFTKKELKFSIGLIARFFIYKTIKNLNKVKNPNIETFTQSTPATTPAPAPAPAPSPAIILSQLEDLNVETKYTKLLDFEIELVDLVGRFISNADFRPSKVKAFEDILYSKLSDLSDENYNIILDKYSVPRNLYDLTDEQMIIIIEISNREDKKEYLETLINTKKLYDQMSHEDKVNFQNLTVDEQESKIINFYEFKKKEYDEEMKRQRFNRTYLPLIIVFTIIFLGFIYFNFLS